MAVRTMSETDFIDEIVNGRKDALVDVSATWCGPCRMLGPVIDDIADDYDGRLDVIKLDVDECRGLAMSLSIMSVPTVLFIRNGEAVGRMVGVRPKEEIAAAVEDVFFKISEEA